MTSSGGTADCTDLIAAGSGVGDGQDRSGGPGVSPTAYVFGELGKRVKSVKKAWETWVLKAHGCEPQSAEHGKLSAESRAQLQAINLHFHDLRHEAGSRWHEAGCPLHHVQATLGHASLEQTSTYLNVTRGGLLVHEAVRWNPLYARCTRSAHRATASVQRRNGQ